jgi:hypothetical protein
VKELEYVARKVIDALNRCQIHGPADRLREWGNKLDRLVNEEPKP